MSGPAQQAASKNARSVVADSRESAVTAPARCRAYALFSALTASPHDVDAAAAAAGEAPGVAGLPFTDDFAALLREFATASPQQLKAEYSGLFEVGSDGPPAPIREDLMTGQKAGTREDIVRFYDYFGYRLGDRFAWAPDHLSVELEFMHYLCFHEATVGEDQLSWQLAQADFAERHLANWAGQLAAAVARLAPGSLYSRVLAALCEFLARDLEWQRTTIVTGGPGVAPPM